MPTNLHLREQLEEFGRALGLEAVPGIASPLDVPFDLDLRLDPSAKRVSCNASDCPTKLMTCIYTCAAG